MCLWVRWKMLLCCRFTTSQVSGLKPLPRWVIVEVCESEEVRTCVWCIYWQQYHCWKKQREKKLCVTETKQLCVCMRVREREGEKMKDTSETFAYLAHHRRYLSTGRKTELWQDVSPWPQLLACTTTQPLQRLQPELQDVNSSETLTYPPKVSSVSIFRKGFIGVAFTNKRAEAGSFGNQLFTRHSEHLFNRGDIETSNNKLLPKLETWADTLIRIT